MRRPGSSEPVPLEDQRTLFELIGRGREASVGAEARVREFFGVGGFEAEAAGWRRLVLVPTGVGSGFRDKLFPLGGVGRLFALAEAAFPPSTNVMAQMRERSRAWTHSVEQHMVALDKVEYQTGKAVGPQLVVYDDGTVVFTVRDWELDALGRRQLVVELSRWVSVGRKALLSSGAHGGLLVGFVVQHSYPRQYAADADGLAYGLLASSDPYEVTRWSSVGAEDEDRIVASILDELAAAAGESPDAPV